MRFFRVLKLSKTTVPQSPQFRDKFRDKYKTFGSFLFPVHERSWTIRHSESAAKAPTIAEAHAVLVHEGEDAATARGAGDGAAAASAGEARCLFVSRNRLWWVVWWFYVLFFAGYPFVGWFQLANQGAKHHCWRFLEGSSANGLLAAAQKGLA